MTEEKPNIEEAIRCTLKENITSWETRGKRHRYGHNTLVVLSIVLSISVTIAGIYDNATLAAVLSAVLAGVLSIQQIFPFGEMSFFYRVGVAEGLILTLDLDTKANTLEEFESLKKKVEILIRKMAQDIPRGQALHEAVQKMKTDIEES